MTLEDRPAPSSAVAPHIAAAMRVIAEKLGIDQHLSAGLAKRFDHTDNVQTSLWLKGSRRIGEGNVDAISKKFPEFRDLLLDAMAKDNELRKKRRALKQASGANFSGPRLHLLQFAAQWIGKLDQREAMEAIQPFETLAETDVPWRRFYKRLIRAVEEAAGEEEGPEGPDAGSP